MITDVRGTNNKHSELSFSNRPIVLHDKNLDLLRAGNKVVVLNQINDITLTELNTQPISNFI